MKPIYLMLYLLGCLLSNVSGFSGVVPLLHGKNRGAVVSSSMTTDINGGGVEDTGGESPTFDTRKDAKNLRTSFSTVRNGAEKDSLNVVDHDPLPEFEPIQSPAGLLCEDHEQCDIDETTNVLPHRGRSRKRVLILCTGGTLTMSNDPEQGNSLAPVQGALTSYLASMRELTDDPEMPEIVSHEYTPLIDSSDMGPGDWAVVAEDIATNYYHFDGMGLSCRVGNGKYTPSTTNSFLISFVY